MIALLLLDLAFPFPVSRMRDRLASSSRLLASADGGHLSWRVDREENFRLVVPLAEASPWLVKATIAVEDRRFRSHPGVDAFAIARAFGQNLASGRRVSGASTITMQTIRLLWQRPRGFDSKLIEAFRALQLERIADKDRILELYFNLAPYGGNLVGVEAASRRYFGKPASRLGLAEAALLAGIPQSPARLDPRRHPEAAKARRDFVIFRMLQEGMIDSGEAERARRRPVEVSPHPRREEALHFVEKALRTAPDDENIVVTTLDRRLQGTLSELARGHGAELASRGVAGPAVVAVSIADGSVRAYVGNASPEHFPARMVDGAGVRRQPGSLLKPFIFAALAETGMVYPSARVYDLPRSWGEYAPRNMDRDWKGTLSAGEALRQSRNLPAVIQLETLGMDRFRAVLSGLGLEAGDSARHGLALALGAREQTLLDLTLAYAVLGRGGLWLPARVREAEAVSEPRRVLSPEAAWLALSALSPPEKALKPDLVWKTGTSWNQQDAWAVAMNREYAVGVWCGRPRRGGSAWTSGVDDALPLAISALAAAGGPSDPWPMPQGVVVGEVCADSGMPPGWSCPETLRTPYLAGTGRHLRCPDHSAEAVRAVDARNVKVPPDAKSSRLRIASPRQGAYYLMSGDGNEALPLSCDGGGATWFMDGLLLGETAAGGALNWIFQPGEHRVSAVDRNGASADATFTVRRFPAGPK
ncbi:MAG: penicillin-binding protein 1C [Planctomycetota bacterium]|nr:penicillin-binding protein 1C [Planctomycetota bacterium]